MRYLMGSVSPLRHNLLPLATDGPTPTTIIFFGLNSMLVVFLLINEQY